MGSAVRDQRGVDFTGNKVAFWRDLTVPSTAVATL